MTDAGSPQPVQLEIQAALGGGQEYGHDWVEYALNTEAPSFVGGVDANLNPQFGGSPGDDEGRTAYA